MRYQYRLKFVLQVGAFHNSSSFIRPLVLDKTKNYTAVSLQGSMNSVFSYQTTYFQRKLWQYRLLASHSFARVGYKITEIEKIRQKHTSMTVNPHLLWKLEKNQTRESIGKVYLLSTVGVFSQWN